MRYYRSIHNIYTYITRTISNHSHLSFNNISDEGAIGIGEGLKINTTLTKLNLYYNNISDDFTCNFLNACSCDTPNLGVEEREEDITTTLRNIQLDEEANTGKFYIIKRLVNRYIDESGEIWYTLIWKHGRKVYHEKRSHLMKYVPQMILNYESFHGY